MAKRILSRPEVVKYETSDVDYDKHIIRNYQGEQRIFDYDNTPYIQQTVMISMVNTIKRRFCSTRIDYDYKREGYNL